MKDVSGRVGWGESSIGYAEVSGGLAEWVNSDDLFVGYAGHGTLDVVEDGEVNCDYGYVGHEPSGVGVTVQRTRRRAVLVGTGSDLCLLKYVPNLEPLSVGDVLLTSGTDQLSPPGLPVGVVTAVSDGPGFFKRVDVRTSADPSRSSEVLVVQGPARQREP